MEPGLIGEWEIAAESDLPGFTCWVKGTGRVKAELGVGGQFLVVTKQGEVAQISDEYVQHLHRDMHTSEDEIEKTADDEIRGGGLSHDRPADRRDRGLSL